MRPHWRRFIGRAVRLHTPERSIEGVLTAVSRELLILRGSFIPNGGERNNDLPLEGEIVVERSRIVFGQVQ